MKYLIILILAVIAYYWLRNKSTKSPSSSIASSPDPTLDQPRNGTTAESDAVESSVASFRKSENPSITTPGGSPGAHGPGADPSAGSNVGKSNGAVVAGPSVSDIAATDNASILAQMSGGVFGSDLQANIQEMLKILNLRPSDSARLAINQEEYDYLKSGTSSLNADQLSEIANRLKKMLG